VYVDPFWFSGIEFILSFALFWRSKDENLRAPMTLSALALVLYVIATAGSVWVRNAAFAACLLAGIHLFFGFIVRAIARNRLPKILIELLIAAGYVAVLVHMLSRNGVNLGGLITTSAVATALIGLSMQEALGNLVAGITLQLEQSIGRGDWLRTDEGVGYVQNVRLRYTTLETADEDLIMVPNSVLTKNPVTIMASKRRRLIPFFVPYGETPTRIMETVEEALRSAPMRDVASDPSPRAIVMEFRQELIQFGVYVWLTRPGHEQSAISDVLTRTYFALSRIGVQVGQAPQLLELRRSLPLPTKVDEEQASVIDRVGLFRSLTESERELLSGWMRKLSFAPGEIVLHQGDQGDSMFFVARGKVRILVKNDTGFSEEVAVLPSGSFFGEMSLLTGEPRSATVIAGEQTDCWRLDKDGVKAILDLRPEVAHDIASVLSQRRAELEIAKQRLDSESEARLREEHHLGLLDRIHKFFDTRKPTREAAGA
jgi:small-conductance mechanosensitive channel/CRP-like cAMP-binding protein